MSCASFFVMEPLFVEKTTSINASALRVWEALTNKEYTKRWIEEFGMDGSIDSDWKIGSPVLWKDASGNVRVGGEVVSLLVGKHLHFTVLDADFAPPPEVDVTDGVTYELKENGGATELTVRQGDFGKMIDGKKYYDLTELVWEKVLPKIKDIAENG